MTKQLQLRWMFNSEKYDFVTELQKATKRQFLGTADMQKALLCTEEDVFLYAKEHQMVKKLIGTYNPKFHEETTDGDYILHENDVYNLYTKERGDKTFIMGFHSEEAAKKWVLSNDDHSDEALRNYIRSQFNFYIKK